MNWEEAKQKVAEKHLYSNMMAAMQDSIYYAEDIFTEAAELWQQSNLERIKNYQEKLNEQLKKIHGQEARIQGQANKIIKQDLRIKELEADKERLDWLQKVMTPKETYCEVYFAGLRDGFADATEFQIESNPWEHFQSIRGESVRDVIDKAKQLLK